MKRGSGVLLHISSLYGKYSIGGFSKAAFEFIDFLSEAGFSYWQVLPFCIADECNSPYKSYSAFSGNPFFVDLETLFKKGLLTDEELAMCEQKTPYVCEYDRLNEERFEILKKASLMVKNKEEIEEFIKQDKNIEKFCEFMARKSKNSQKCWNEWEDLEPDDDELFMWKFIQYEFFSQWFKIKEYANEKGIKIIGDIPIFVSYDSCDVWANKEQFLLDEENLPKCVAGVPPDYFSQDGQLWGNPLYDWEYMKKDNYSWWQERIKFSLKLFDCLRIDHFRGFESYWSIPYESESAKNGKWEKGPGREFIDIIKSVSGDKLIIAEDLGDITEDVIDLVNYSGFPGMRVLQFGFLGDDDNIHMPHNYINNQIAYTGTHDNNTLLGYVWELDEKKRCELLSYCGYESDDWNRGYDSIIKTMFKSSAGIVILPIQDILGFGADTRLNTPGVALGNWEFRITKEQLNSIDKTKYLKLNKLYKR